MFIKDLATGVVSRVSETAGHAVGDGASQFATFSPDGTKVLFYSTSTNLVPGDTNFVAGQTFSGADWYVKDLITGAVMRVSTDAAGLQGNSVGGFGALYQSFTYPHWSPDGAFVTFDANFGNLLPGAATLTAAGALSFMGTPISNGGSSTIDWSYNPANANLDFLREGQALTITYDVQVSDGTANSNVQPLTITITGKNDAPVLAPVTGPAAVPVTAGNSSAQDIAPIHGALLTTDKDVGDTLTASIIGSPVVNLVNNGVATSFTLPNGASALTGGLSFDSVVASDGGLKAINWTYDPGPAVLDFLSQGQSLTLAYTVKVNDGTVDSNTQPLMITITGANAPVVTESLAFDTGASTTDRVTSNAALSGTGLANTVVHFTIDGSPIVATVVTDPLGAWSFAPTGLTDGAHTIVASQTDGFGHTGTATLSFTLDTAAPAAPTLALGTGVANGATAAEATAAGGVVTVTGEAGDTISVTFTNGVHTVTKTLTGTGGAQAVTLTAGDLTTLTDGTISVSATQTDAAGNPQTTAAATTSFTLDTAAPAAPTLALGTGVANGATAAEATAAGGVVTVTGEAGDTISVTFTNGVHTVTKTLTGTGGAQAVTLTAGDLTTLTDGTISVSATQTDAAGNPQTTAAATTSFTLDTAAPAAPSLALGTGVANGATAAEATAAGGVVTVTGEAGDTISVTFTNGVHTVTKTLTGTGGAQAVTLTAGDLTALTDGTISVSATQTDAAGNPQTTAAATTSFKLDTAAPVAPSTPDLASASDSGNSTDNNTNIAAATFTGTAEAGSTVTIFSDGVAVGSVLANGGNYSITTSALVDGTRSVTAKAIDTAGNTSLASSPLSVVIDTAAPAETLAITSIADSPSPTDQAITVSGSNSALARGDKVQISADDQNWTDVVQNTATTWSYADSVTRTANFTYRTRIVDIAANVGATATQDVFVANNGATISVGAASSGLVAKFTGTAGGTLQLLGPPGITGTVNAISIASGLIAISGNASVTTSTGDAIDLTATGATQANPAILNVNLTGPITGAASGIAVTQNAYGSITVSTSGPVIGLAGRGIYAQQSATGVGSILINGSGNVTGIGAAFSGIVAQNSNTANNADVTVAQTGSVSGGRDGIRAQTNGNGNVIVSTGASATITGTSLYGIEAVSNGLGNITVTTANLDIINSGSAGINAYNQTTSISQAVNSLIAVTANGTINSGATYTGGGSRSAGILAGYRGGTTNTANTTGFGNVMIDNLANINAAGGDGIRGYNYGPGNVTVNDHGGTINAKDMFGITASSNSTGKVSITTSAGTVINSGSSAIQAINQGLTVPAGALSTVSVTAFGTLHSGNHLTPGGSQPQAISAGYFGSNGTSNTAINGTVLVDNFANVTADAGTGVNAYNWGNGSVTVIQEAGTPGTPKIVSGAQYGITAYSLSSGAGSAGSVTINVGANATITARALYGIAAIQGNINNSGNVSITTGTGDTINSGGTGINSNNIATSAASSQISITTLGGTVNSGYNFFQGGGTPSGISAGYGTNGALSTALHGNVNVDNSATINAVSGAGVNLYNNGVGSVSATLRAGSINAAQGGVNAFSAGGGNITVDNRATVNAGTIGINTGNGASNPSSANGLISVINSGTVNAPGLPYIPVVNIGNSNSSQTATLSNNSGGTIAAGMFGRTTSNVAVSIYSGNGAITNSGTITGNVALFANGNFTNAIGGIWNLNGNNNFGTGATAISNAGTMNVSGWTFLSANGGLVALSNTNTINVAQNSVAQIFANVSGAGAISVGDRSALEIGGSVAASQRFNILGRGLLTFDNAAAVGPNLPINFTSATNGNIGSVITMSGAGFTGSTPTNPTLTAAAVQSYSLQMSGSGLTGNMFDVLSPNRLFWCRPQRRSSRTPPHPSRRLHR